MIKSAQTPNTRKSELPFLIVDKRGVIGKFIAQEIARERLVIFVSGQRLEDQNIVHIPFRKEIPVVPDNTYSDILFVDDKNTISRESITTFIKKAKDDNSEFIFVTALLESNPTLLDTIKNYQSSKIVVIGEVFDEELTYDLNSTPSKFVQSIKQEGRIRIEGDGMKLTFPVYFKDVIEQILKIVNEGLTNQIYCLYPKYPLTHLSLAHVFQRINPLIKIDFTKEKIKDTRAKSSIEGTFPLGDNYLLEQRIKNLNLTRKIQKEKIYEITTESYFFRKSLFLIILFLAFFIFLPLSTSLIYAKLGVIELNSAKKELESGSLIKAKRNAENAKSFFNISESSSEILITEASILGRQKEAKDLNDQISLGLSVAQATSYLVDAANDIQNISSQSTVSPGAFSSVSNSLKNSIAIFRKIEANKNTPPYLTEKIQSLNPLVDLLSESIDQLPGVLGFSDERKYLVLFQNNMELRSTGGFIGSYGILKIKNARILDFSIFDVYDADGQLKQHLEPPYAIRRYLPSEHFYLRDSNFYIDFPEAAEAAENFLRLEKNEQFDGVFAADVTFVSNILTAIGGVEVPNYDVKVTGDNLFQLAEKHSQAKFFPGSTQKKDFLSSVFRSIQDSLTNNKNVPYLSLAQVVGNSLNQKHLLFYFNDSQAQTVAHLNNFSSSIFDKRPQQQGSVNDYLGINESNLGVNKVNYHIARSVSKTVDIERDGKISSRVTIAYKNSSIKDDYKNYLRLILPLNANLKTITINGTPQNIVDAVTQASLYESKSFKLPVGFEVEKTTESQKNVYGFLIIVPKNNLKTISIEYELPGNIKASTQPASYSLRFLKQPGTSEYPFGFSLNYPSSFNFTDSNKKITVKDRKITFIDQVEKDFDLNIQLAQK